MSNQVDEAMGEAMDPVPQREGGETAAAHNIRLVRERLDAGMSHQDAYRGLPEADNPPADFTRDGDGVWIGGKWYADCPWCQGVGGVHVKWCRDTGFMKTHHAPGSPEETYSRRMRFDKYLAMQQLLGAIAAAAPEDNHAMQFQGQARAILAGMVRPRGPSQRSVDRAAELDLLALAYRIASGVFPVESPHLGEARAILLEALKAWERAHPPAAIDPLLGPV